MKRGRKGEERKTRRKCLESEPRVWIERGKWNQPTGGRGLARVAESAYWKGFLPSWLRPASKEVVKEAALTVDAPGPGEEFRLRSSGFPIGLSSRDRNGFLLQSYSANGGFLLLNRLRLAGDSLWQPRCLLSAQQPAASPGAQQQPGALPQYPSRMPATPGKASTVDYFTYHVFTELDLVEQALEERIRKKI